MCKKKKKIININMTKICIVEKNIRLREDILSNSKYVRLWVLYIII